jgi:hypothetical protein
VSIGQTLAKEGLARREDPDKNDMLNDLTPGSSLEGTPSEGSCDDENDDVIEVQSEDDNGTVQSPEDSYYTSEKVLEFNDSRELGVLSDAQPPKPKSDDLLEKLLSTRVGFATKGIPTGTPTPLLTPQEFSVTTVKSTKTKTSDLTRNEENKAASDTSIQEGATTPLSDPDVSQTNVETEDEKKQEEGEKEKELNDDAPESTV